MHKPKNIGGNNANTNKTKKNLYNYLVKKGVYDKISWGKK